LNGLSWVFEINPSTVRDFCYPAVVGARRCSDQTEDFVHIRPAPRARSRRSACLRSATPSLSRQTGDRPCQLAPTHLSARSAGHRASLLPRTSQSRLTAPARIACARSLIGVRLLVDSVRSHVREHARRLRSSRWRALSPDAGRSCKDHEPSALRIPHSTGSAPGGERRRRASAHRPKSLHLNEKPL
jgi:hypothetical protein